MNIVIVNGQNHRGSTHLVARELAEKVGGTITEFFLPRDFDEPCLGCWACFQTDMTHCPHYEKLRPITQALDEADLIILASPVYVFHATGQMMAFLNHYGSRWLVHRPEPCMFHKQAVCVSTAAGGGMKTTNKDLYDSLFFWGIPKIYQLGVAVRAASPKQIPEKILQKIHRRTDALAKKIRENQTPSTPALKARFWFHAVRLGHSHGLKIEPDYTYWEERGWHGKSRPWKEERR
ncbi:flavodoxin family protein [Acidaminobacterium chupaoyuni]